MKNIFKSKKLKKVLKAFYSIVKYAFPIVLILILAVTYFLPDFIQSSVLPSIVTKFPFELSGAGVRRVGLAGADVDDIYLGGKEDLAVKISSLRIDYSPFELLLNNTVQVERLALSGVEIKCKYKNGKFILPGFNMPEKSVSGKASKTESKKSKYKVKIASIFIEQGTFILEMQGQVIRIPFRINCAVDDITKLSLNGLVIIEGNKIEFSASLDQNTKQAYFSFKSIIDFKRFSDLMPDGLSMRGKADIESKVNMGLSPFKINDLNLRCLLSDYKLKNGGINISGTNKTRLEMTGKDKEFNLAIRHLNMDSGLKINLKSLENKISLLPEGFNVSSKANLQINELPGGMKLDKAVQIFPETSLRYNNNGTWKLHNIKNKALSTAFNAEIKNNKFSCKPLTWDLKGQGTKGKPKVNLKIKISDIKMQSPYLTAKLPAANFAAAYSEGKVSGSVYFKNGKAHMQAAKISLSGIKCEIPFSFPLKADSKPSYGSFDIGDIKWQGKRIADFKSKITYNKKGCRLKGTCASDLLPDFKINLDSKLDFKANVGFQMKANLPEYILSDKINLESLSPALEGLKLNGKIAANADIQLKKYKLDSSARVLIKDVKVEKDFGAISIDGINLDLRLVDLIKLASMPEQKLTFKSFTAAAVKVYDGKIDFQIESLKSVLLEKSSFGWCGGNLYTHALRVIVGEHSYRATFFCDGIVLSQLLNELGIAKASGSGEIMGRIPVVFDKRGFTFKEAFLFSVPGQGNRLKLMDTEKLLNGIPKGTAQAAQLDIACEALKDFDYQWVKINLATEGEALKVKMQIDGKPAALLPFTYNKKKGYFVRVKGKGAKFQGIRLNVNSNVPLNRLLLFNNSSFAVQI